MEVDDAEEKKREMDTSQQDNHGQTTAAETTSATRLINSIDNDSESSDNDYDYIDAVHKHLSDEQHRLDHSDRISIHEEIHGVLCRTREETPAVLQASAIHLSCELLELVRTDAYTETITASLLAGRTPSNEALRSSLAAGYLLSQCCGTTKSTYVNSLEFRLRFLRCENFDAKKAAVKMMNYLNLVLECFGTFALFRPIRLSDFRNDERRIMQGGWLQVLPFRDRSGRKVFVWVGDLGINNLGLVRIRITIFVLLAGTRDAESQRKGIVTVVWPTLPSKTASTASIPASDTRNESYLPYCKRAMVAIPVHTCSVHCCMLSQNKTLLSPWWKALCKRFLMVCGNMVSYVAPRTRFYFGNVPDTQKILSGYGIPVTLIPVTNSGCLKTAYFKQWLKLQQRIDDADDEATASSFIDCPNSNDVVFRMGSRMLRHPGNVAFRGLIESKIEDTSKVPPWSVQKTKEDIAIEIVREVVQEKKGRFLIWHNKDECWKELHDVSQMTTKVAITYRDLKLKLAKIQKDQQMSL